jgi:3-dehydroquinate dehydratase type I
MVNPPRICVPVVSESQIITSVEPLVDFFEVRIDLIGKGWRNVIPQLKKPWIACNRRVEEGGVWQENEEKRIKELLNALDLGANFIDLELGTSAVNKIVKEVKGRASVIVSYHNLRETPPVDRLRQIVANQVAVGADICKVVTTARAIKDNAEVLEFIGLFHDVKLISFEMGMAGQISRMLGRE